MHIKSELLMDGILVFTMRNGTYYNVEVDVVV